MNVLVLDGNQNQAVASVRSLARAGHLVYVAETRSWSKAGWSRGSSGSYRYSSPHEHPEAFIAELVNFVRQRPGTLILPMTEATTLPISCSRDALFSAGARLILPDHADLLRAFDKEETARLATSLGIAIPSTTVIESREQAREMADSVRYPVVLKPRCSEEFVSAAKVRTGGRPRYARDNAQFLTAYDDISRRTSAVLVQEFVSGEGCGYFALMRHGELRAEFAHRRIRDVHPTGSGSALRISVAPDPQIRKSSLAILRALRWHGVAMVEYRKPARGTPIFIEVNGRFWNSLALACYSGVDFPAWLAQMAEHGDVDFKSGYRDGVRCRWWLGDARHLAEVWRGAPAGYPGVYPHRWSTLLKVLMPVPGTYHDLFQWKDPLPELGDWIFASSRLLGKWRKV